MCVIIIVATVATVGIASVYSLVFQGVAYYLLGLSRILGLCQVFSSLVFSVCCLVLFLFIVFVFAVFSSCVFLSCLFIMFDTYMYDD